jgi:ribose 5-phosphate isomerase B
MKRFDLITESDARVLPLGEPVMLARGGHVTPLAHDTLKERRIAIVDEARASVDDAALVPAADVRSIAIASDHTGIKLRQMLVVFLRGRALAVTDLGTGTADPVDYPDVAASVATLVARREVDAGIVIDGAGIGSAIAANKIHGVRAVMAMNETIARYGREHNGANVLTLGSTLIDGPDAAIRIVDVWLGTAMKEPRYIRRLLKIRRLEEQNR